MDLFSRLVDRRKFLKSGLKYASLAGLCPVLLSYISRAFAGTPARLALCEGADSEACLKKALDHLGGIGKFVIKGDNVVIKPNMAFANPPQWGNVTNPTLAAALVKQCVLAGAKKITLIDFPQGDPKRCLERNLIASQCEKAANIEVKMLKDRSQFRKVKVPKGKVLKEVEIAQDILKADVFINIPVAKSHDLTKVSFGMKNLMGLIWDRVYFHKMVEINQAIADLSSVLRANLTILDATRCMTTNGPAGPGKVSQLKTVIAGTDPVAIDAYATGIAKWNDRSMSPDDVSYIKFAADMKLGRSNLNKIKIMKFKV